MKIVNILKYFSVIILITLSFSCSDHKKKETVVPQIPQKQVENDNVTPTSEPNDVTPTSEPNDVTPTSEPNNVTPTSEPNDVTPNNKESIGLIDQDKQVNEEVSDDSDSESMNLTDINKEENKEEDKEENKEEDKEENKEVNTVKAVKKCSFTYQNKSYEYTLYNDGTLKSLETVTDSTKQVLSEKETIKFTDIKDLVCNQGNAFVVLKNNGTIVAWGEKMTGGDPNYEHSGYYDSVSKANGELTEVEKIVATQKAFAALTRNGSVITWGNDSFGGNLVKTYPANADLTSGVKDIVATDEVFAALKNGTVITWGQKYIADPNTDTSDIAKPNGTLVGIEKIVATRGAFAALKKDENGNTSVITWGEKSEGGDPSYSPSDLEKCSFDVAFNGVLDKNIDNIFSNKRAFAARKTNGIIIPWGISLYTQALEKEINLLPSTKLEGNFANTDRTKNTNQIFNDEIEKIKEISGYTLWSNGTITITDSINAVYAWQFYTKITNRKLENIKDFVATKTSSSNTLAAALTLENVKDFVATKASNTDIAFAALIEDKKGNTSVFTWGNKNNGGDPTFSSDTTHAADAPLKNVKKIVSTHAAFAAIIEEGNGTQSVVTWGDIRYGGDLYSSVDIEEKSEIISHSKSYDIPSTNTGYKVHYVVSNYGSFAVIYTKKENFNTNIQSAYRWGNNANYSIYWSLAYFWFNDDLFHPSYDCSISL